jgi:hypothetical protein
MPKLQHTFVQGKMNKDLDERLVPNGQYRDAQNIQISTSEGSDVGAVENILGNTKKNLRSTNPDVYWADGFGLTNTVCIGVVRDTQNEKIYWFIIGEDTQVGTVSAIVEYDETTDIVAPILVDTQGYLNFSYDYLITGVNVLDGMLMWTDGLNEPKIIDIELFKAGSTDFTTDTQVYGRDFEESDVTVIKPKPLAAPTVNTFASLRGGNGTGIDPVTTNAKFTENIITEWVPVEVGSLITFTVSATPNWIVGDIIIMDASSTNDNDYEDEWQIRATVTVVSGTSITAEVESIPYDLPNQTLEWSCLLEEDEPMFELSFPRFAYRWKFANNTYSAYSPFSNVAFEPNYFSYTPDEAFNEGMTNNIRKIELSGFSNVPDDVDELEILYKDSNETSVYKVDAVPPTTTLYSIDSELIYSVVNPDQLIRPYDNVPRKAKAQELIGNRIVYGNYVQNYDVDNTLTDISASIVSSNINNVKYPEPSVKSMRDYNVGIVYMDKYGRETPVFTSENSAVRVPKSLARRSNKIEVLSSHTAPSWATHFKYYVKDPSNEYYNVIIDRVYDSGDGNVWLAIPSAERNKLSEDKFIELKKAHKSDDAVISSARYRVLDIKSEAPESIANEKTQVAYAAVTNVKNTDSTPANVSAGDNEFTFSGPSDVTNGEFIRAWQGTVYIKFRGRLNWGSNQVTSGFYKVEDGGLKGSDPTTYRVKLEEVLDTDTVNIIYNSVEAVEIQVYQEEYVSKPEYLGKFFVKINRDTPLDNNVIYGSEGTEYTYDIMQQMSNIQLNALDDPANGTSNIAYQNRWAWGEFYDAGPPVRSFATGPNGPFPPNANNAVFSLGWIRNTTEASGTPNTPYEWVHANLAAGHYVRFRNPITGQLTEPKEILSVFRATNARVGITPDSVVNGSQYFYVLKITLVDPLPSTFTWANDIEEVHFMRKRRLKPTIFDTDSVILSTPNPAVFETEPTEIADIDLYYEATNALPIGLLNTSIELDWFNCYSFGNGVESDRIRDDFNAKTITKGVKVSTVLDEPYAEEHRGSGLIWSGLYNSTSGVNELNQFIQGLKISKDLNPIYGTIQKLSSRGGGATGDLLVLCEDKCFKVLADKDALYNADGNTNLTSTNRVLGQAIPFAGDFGISKNPESFASFGFRSYFTDKARGSVLRLSMDGLTELNEKGMSRYFQEKLKAHTGPIIGAYDEDVSSYNVAVGDDSVSFKERIDGWPTRLSYQPEFGVSMNNSYYTFQGGELWIHTNPLRANFYGSQYDATITPIINDAPTSIKNFKTLSYEGSEGWVADVITDQQDGEVKTWKKKEGIFFNYINGLATTWDNTTQSGALDTSEFSVQGLGVLTEDADDPTPGIFEIVLPGKANVSLQANDPIYYKSAGNGLVYIIGKLFAINNGNLLVVQNSYGVAPPQAGDFVFFAKDSVKNTSGIVGYYAEVLMTLSGSDPKELFAVNSEVFISSE